MEGQQGLFNLHEYTNARGDQVVEEVHLSLLAAENGQPLGVIESVRDVSEAKRLEGSLTGTNEFLNCLLNSMVGMVVAADMAMRIIFTNQNTPQITGYAGGELLGRSLRELMGKREMDRLLGVLRQSLGPVRGLRSKVRKRSGEEIPVLVNLSYIYRDNAPIGILAIIRDIRERMDMERHLNSARMQVVQSEKLAVLGRVAAGVAHELNNPLTGITVYGELVRENLPADHPVQADLVRIMDDADRCRDIVRDLLDYSRQSKIQVEALDLSQVVREAIGLIPQDSVSLHVKIETDFAEQPLMVRGDRKLLRQVFINLIGNAFDAMSGRGLLTARTYLDGDGLRCAEVTDTGGGIPADYLDKVFDPFFTTKPPGKGTGLGLSVAYGVMSRHGGKLRVKESGPQGTTFLAQLAEHPPRALMEYDGFSGDSEPDGEVIG